MTNKSKTDGGLGAEPPQGSTTSPKEAYQQPHLIVYGNIREITKSVGKSGPNDGGVVMDLTMSML